MNADGSKVDFRASVPFDRPEGEQVAVVAQENAATDAGPGLGLIGGGTFDKLRTEADKALALLKGLYADGRVPSAEELAAALDARGVTVLLDDRAGVSAGVKFKDAELIGVPTVVVVGRGLADGVVEVRDRATGERFDAAVAEAADRVAALAR